MVDRWRICLYDLPVADPHTEVPTWVLHLLGASGIAGFVKVAWPGIVWVVSGLGGLVKKLLEKKDAPPQFVVNVGMPQGLGMPEQPAQPPFVAQGYPPPPVPTMGMGMPPPAAPSAPAALPPAQHAHAFGADTPVRERDSFVDIAQQLANAQLAREREFRPPTEPVTWREHKALVDRFESSERQQQFFRDTVLQRTARICERLQIQIEEENRDENGHGS